MWLDNSFKKYKKIGLTFIYEKAENKLTEDEIDIQSIEELDMRNFGHNNTISQQEVWFIDKINELVRTTKQLDNKINK